MCNAHITVPVTERMANSNSLYRRRVAKRCHERSMHSAKELILSGTMFKYYELEGLLYISTFSYIVYEKYNIITYYMCDSRRGSDWRMDLLTIYTQD
jgi:hypothetical protein